MTGVKILGVGKCVPEGRLTNDDLAKIVDTNDEWIVSRTGISSRRIAAGEPTFHLAAEASKQALERAGLKGEDIGLIIATSITSDYYTPSVACMVQREIGATGSMTIDVNCACSGFVYGFDMAKRYLQTDDSLKYVLVVSAEELSKITDYKDRSTCILFGDGAAAVVVERKEDTLYSSYLGADGNGAQFLMARNVLGKNPLGREETVIDEKMPEGNGPYLYQDGKEVYRFATRVLPMVTKECCQKAGIEPGDIDVIVPHQANFRIIETAAKNLKLPMDKFFLNLSEYGNTSSASIPIAFCEAIEKGKVKSGDKVCFVGFGAGLTYAGVIFEY